MTVSKPLVQSIHEEISSIQQEIGNIKSGTTKEINEKELEIKVSNVVKNLTQLSSKNGGNKQAAFRVVDINSLWNLVKQNMHTEKESGSLDFFQRILTITNQELFSELDPDKVNELINQGKVNAPFASGLTPLEYACMMGRQDLILSLVLNGADVSRVKLLGNEATSKSLSSAIDQRNRIVERLFPGKIKELQNESTKNSNLLADMVAGFADLGQDLPINPYEQGDVEISHTLLTPQEWAQVAAEASKK